VSAHVALVLVLVHLRAPAAAVALPFTLRSAYPVLALVSGALGTLVAVVLVLTRLARRGARR